MILRKIIPAVALGLIASGAQAEDLIDTTAFIGDVSSASNGHEIISPQFLELEMGQGGCQAVNGCINFRFKISSPVKAGSLKNTTHRYNSAEKQFKFPNCPNGSTLREWDWNDRYVRIGNKMAVAMELLSECQNNNTFETETKHNTYVYLSNVSNGSAGTKVYTYLNHELVGFDKAPNLNNYGSNTDFMVTVFKDNDTNNKVRFDLFEQWNLNRYIQNQVVVDR